jgi:hypothetical protein
MPSTKAGERGSRLVHLGCVIKIGILKVRIRLRQLYKCSIGEFPFDFWQTFKYSLSSKEGGLYYMDEKKVLTYPLENV